jgi:hypothetical protein
MVLRVDPFPLLFDKTASIAMENVGVMFGVKYLEFTLSQLLFASREFLCTDPRDHVYALLGLAADVETGYKGLAVDYASPTRKVLHQFCVCNVKEKGSLDFLGSGLQGHHEDTSGPSWVPNVLSPSQFGVDPAFFTFTATGNSALQACFSQDERTLTIMGKTIDEVKALSQPLITLDDSNLQPDLKGGMIVQEEEQNQFKEARKSNDEPAITNKVEHDYKEWYKEWFRHCKQIACTPYSVPTSAARLEQFHRTLLWGSSLYNSSEAEAISLETCSLVAEYLSKFNDVSAWCNPDESWLARVAFLTREIEVPFCQVFRSRRFCSTINDRLGSTPHNAEAGDIVCVFYGGNLPYVIRRCGEGQYKFIGDCYLHGFMRGAAMELDSETQEFVLV